MAVNEIFQIPGYVQVKLNRKHLGHNVNYQNQINNNKKVYISMVLTIEVNQFCYC